MRKWIGFVSVIGIALLLMALPSRHFTTDLPVARRQPRQMIPPLAPAAVSLPTFSASSTSFEEVLAAHGGRQAIAAVASLRVEAARLSIISLTDFFERQMVISRNGAQFKRRTADPLGLRTEIEWLDPRGGFHAAVITRAANGDAVSAPALEDDSRRHDVQLMADTCCLLLILQRSAESSVRVTAVERAAQGLDKFSLVTAAGPLIIFADQSHLVRRVEMGEKVFQYGDYRAVGRLRLPFIQRLSIGSRLFYEWFIGKIDLHPTFPPDFFNAAD